MNRYGYDTYDSRTYCITDLKKNVHIATVFHVTDADRIVMLLNLDENDLARLKQSREKLAAVLYAEQRAHNAHPVD